MRRRGSVKNTIDIVRGGTANVSDNIYTILSTIYIEN